MTKLSTLRLFGFGIAVTALPTLLYFLLKSDRKSPSVILKSTFQSHVKIIIPKDVIGNIIGKKGVNIKKIEQSTNTKLKVIDNIIIVRGKSKDVQKAKLIINRIINEKPVMLVETIMINSQYIGFIIGKRGVTINEIKNTSKCSIEIDRETTGSNEMKITMKGTNEQITRAKELIEKYHHSAIGRTLSVGSVRPSPNTPAVTPTLNQNGVGGDDALHNGNGIGSGEGVNTVGAGCGTGGDASREYKTICITAMCSPDRFWVQFVNEEDHAHLNKLLNDMTEHYNAVHDLTEENVFAANLGDVVAARFEGDDIWYRAKVCDIEDDVLDLYFIDFGDSVNCNRSKVRLLRDEYKQLEPQATECLLYGVIPATGQDWSEEAIDYFTSLTHCAKWVSVSGCVVDYVKRESQSDDSGTMVEIPCVLIVERQEGGTEVDIRQEMINKGFAKLKQ